MESVKYERVRRWIVRVGLAYFLFMAYMLLYPKPYVPPPARWAFDIVHFLAFAALGAFVALGRRRWSIWIWLFLLACWGIGSEYLQRFTGRCFEYGDMAQNVVGILCGTIVFRGLRRSLVRDV